MMKLRTIAIAAVLATVSFGAGAQVDPGFHEWTLMDLVEGSSNANKVSVYAESLIRNVTVEHWVVSQPDEQGFRLGDSRITWSGEEYDSSQDFLHTMWNRSVQDQKQWFYARQMVVYQPLSGVSAAPLYGEENVIACTQLLNEAGERVGVQVRTAAWSMYTDHWVLYPTYSPPSPDHEVIFDAQQGCENPGEWLDREIDNAEASGQLEQFLYATTTFALVPLTPGTASPPKACVDDPPAGLQLDGRARRPNLFPRRQLRRY